MSSKTVRFRSCEWLPDLGGGKRILFKYSIVDTAFVDSFDEASHIDINDVTVKISYSQESMWNLEQSELEKVLFEYARRNIASKVEENALTQHEEILLYTYTTPNICPYDPDRIIMSFDKSYEIPVKRSFGFQTRRNE
jgi:hypothetical protein